MSAHTQEEILNAKLAELLTAQDVPAKPERRERGKRMDVVTDVDGLRVVLEAETGFRRKKQAIKDADARLKQGLTTIVFALCYPDGVTTDSLADATLTWTLRTKAGVPDRDRRPGLSRHPLQVASGHGAAPPPPYER